MHYSDRPHMVRADFFKESGKWYATEAISMEHLWDVTTAVHAVAMALWVYSRLIYNTGFHAVVLEPYHRNGIPVMLNAIGMEACVMDVERWDPSLVAKMRQIKIHKERANA